MLVKIFKFAIYWPAEQLRLAVFMLARASHLSMGRVGSYFGTRGNFVGKIQNINMEVKSMRKQNFILFLLNKLCNRSWLKTKTNVKVDVQQKIVVTVINISR